MRYDVVIDREEVYRMYDNISYYDRLETKWGKVRASLNVEDGGLSEFEIKALEARYKRAKAKHEAALEQECNKLI